MSQTNAVQARSSPYSSSFPGSNSRLRIANVDPKSKKLLCGCTVEEFVPKLRLWKVVYFTFTFVLTFTSICRLFLDIIKVKNTEVELKDNYHLWVETLIFLLIASSLLPLIFCLLFFVRGNYATDGKSLGTHTSSLNAPQIKSLLTFNACQSKYSNFFRRFHTQCWPYFIAAQQLCAILLLLTRTNIIVLLMRLGIISSDYIWMSEMENKAKSESHNLLLSNGTQWSNDIINAADLSVLFHGFSLEFINLCFSFAMGLLIFPAIFWDVNRLLSSIISIYTLVVSVYCVSIICGFQVLYKVYASNLDLGINLVLNSSLILVLFFVTFIFLLLCIYNIIAYAFFMYNESLNRLQKRNWSKHFYQTPSIFSHYSHHMCSVVFVILVISFRAPIIYDSIKCLTATPSLSLKISVILDATFFLFALILWILISIKKQWIFVFARRNVSLNVAYCRSGSVKIKTHFYERNQLQMVSSVTDSASNGISCDSGLSLSIPNIHGQNESYNREQGSTKPSVEVRKLVMDKMTGQKNPAFYSDHQGYETSSPIIVHVNEVDEEKKNKHTSEGSEDEKSIICSDPNCSMESCQCFSADGNNDVCATSISPFEENRPVVHTRKHLSIPSVPKRTGKSIANDIYTTGRHETNK